jgi:hypothetical protein
MKKYVLLFVMTLAFVRYAQSQQVSLGAEQDLKNMKTFIQNGTFMIPKGVSRVVVELWGGGGGGTVVGGGGGAAYGKAIIEVSEGNLLSVEVGQGGAGHLTNGLNGTASAIGLRPGPNAPAALLFRAAGGTGSESAINTAMNGTGGKKADAAAVVPGYYSFPGEDGETYTEHSYQNGAAQTVIRNFGKGGNAGNTQYTGGRGAAMNLGGSGGNVRAGAEGKMPGGGGGSNYAGKGFNGGGGMVIIHY